MNSVSTVEIKLRKTKEGVIRIGDTRVSIDSVIIAFKRGAEPESIQRSFDRLTLAEVYSVISYYLNNRDELDEYLATREKQFEEMREANNARFGLNGMRDELLARRREST
jgi:uncharacterized protein (DUF433 family)